MILEVQIMYDLAKEKPMFSIYSSEFLNLLVLNHFDLRTHLYIAILEIKTKMLLYCFNSLKVTLMFL